MFDPKLHFAVIVRPMRTLMHLTAILAVAVLTICIVGLWVLMMVAEFCVRLLHLIVSTPLLLAGAIVVGIPIVVIGAVVGVQVGLRLCRAVYHFLMAL